MTNQEYCSPSDFFDGLTTNQCRLLQEVATAMKVPIECSVNTDSIFCSIPAFVEEFQNRLILYHALNEDVLKKKTFEYTFVRAANVAGMDAHVVTNSVNSGEDAIVNGIKYSLKTEADEKINNAKIKISKLMEARWIRECRSGEDFVVGLRNRVLPHLEHYEHILVLRAFKRPNNMFEYRLVEIPRDILLLMRHLKPVDFSPRTKNGTSRASVLLDDNPVFQVRFDGSVEKVTISGLLESACIVHGIWKVPIGVADSSAV